MNEGTYGTFQGFAVRACTFRRGRGYTPGGAEIIMAVADFPVGFTFDTPAPGDLAKPVAAPDAGTTVRGPVAVPAQLPKRLSYEGWLVMSEAVRDVVWSMPPIRLFIERVDTLKLEDTGGKAMIRIVAWDERYHWELGWLRRWSFNRKRADGGISMDSVKSDGTLFTRLEVAQQVVASIFRKPELTKAPDEWSNNSGPVNFGPNAAAVAALQRMVADADLVEPCLRFDGSVALVRPGDGQIGYAEGGVGANEKPFPPGMLLWKDGAGQGQSVQLAYPEDTILVSGGPRLASVAIDDLEPVVILEDVVYLLSDENVKLLTKGKRDLAWLRKFVFAPAEWAGDPEIPEPILEVFRTQAFRLWRIPGVIVETQKATATEAAILGPGPNAHLMPMLPRAESIGSKRPAVLVETYTFAVRRRRLSGSGSAIRQAAATAELRRLRDEIASAARSQGNTNPFNSRAGYRLQSGRRVSSVIRDIDPTSQALDLARGERQEETFSTQEVLAGSMLTSEAATEMGKARQSVADLEAMVREARTVERIRAQAGDGFARLYENALKERFAAQDTVGGVDRNATLYDLAKKFIDAEKTANEQGSNFDNTTEAMIALGLDKAWSQQVVDAMKKLRLQQEQTRARGGAEGQNEVMTFYVNVGRSVDTGARVYDEERGIIETSGLAGHLKDPAVHDLGHPDAELIPCPVRVTFGTHLRPRVDVPPGRVQTGQPVRRQDAAVVAAGDCPGGDTVIPEALTDELSYFVQAFRRVGAGASPVELDQVEADQALVVQRPDLVELLPLVGASNRGALYTEALEVARELFRRPAVVRGASATIARAWPVQCDGLVQEVTIRMRQKNGAPCGYETELTIGDGGPVQRTVGQTRERPRPEFRGMTQARVREGLQP